MTYDRLVQLIRENVHSHVYDFCGEPASEVDQESINDAAKAIMQELEAERQRHDPRLGGALS